VVLDVFSRRVVGWELGESLQTSLALVALDRALADRQVPAGIIHHSDQGLQHALADRVDRLQTLDFQISMSRKGSPWENGRVEGFIKTLKTEEVWVKQYGDNERARRSIGHFLVEVSNQRRLHSALGYLSPVQFAANCANQAQKEAATRQLSRQVFFRRGRSIHPMCKEKRGAGLVPTPGAHRYGGVLAGYSWRVALQQLPLLLHRPESACYGFK
jgi:hypothetical protein